MERKRRMESCVKLPQGGSRGLYLASCSVHLQLHLVPANYCKQNHTTTAEINKFFLFFSLMNRHPSKSFFKCMIEVYDIVMDLKSVIISLSKNKLDST